MVTSNTRIGGGKWVWNVCKGIVWAWSLEIWEEMGTCQDDCMCTRFSGNQGQWQVCLGRHICYWQKVRITWHQREDKQWGISGIVFEDLVPQICALFHPINCSTPTDHHRRMLHGRLLMELLLLQTGKDKQHSISNLLMEGLLPIACVKIFTGFIDSSFLMSYMASWLPFAATKCIWSLSNWTWVSDLPMRLLSPGVSKKKFFLLSQRPNSHTMICKKLHIDNIHNVNIASSGCFTLAQKQDTRV